MDNLLDTYNYLENVIGERKIKRIFWGLVFIISVGTLFYMVAENLLSKNNERYYLQGLNFVSQKDYQNAYFNFSSVEKGNEYYCPSKYRAALSAENLYDKNSAIIMYKDVINNCSQTLFEEHSRFHLAKLYFEQAEYKKAQAWFDTILKVSEIKRYKIASNYFLGQILLETNPKEAQAYLLKYIEEVPDGKYADNAIDVVFKTKLPLNSKQNYIIAISLYQNGWFAEAKKYFSHVPLEKSWFYLMMCDRKLQNYKQAKSYAQKGINEYGLEDLNDNNIYETIDFYAQFDSSKKNGYLNIANTLLPQMKAGGDYALYKYIEYLPQQERLPYYHRILDIYPDGRFASEAMWKIIYSQYKKGNYKKVIELAEEHNKKYSDTNCAPRVLFFAAKAAQKAGLYSKSKNYFIKILEKYPDNYYAFRAKLLLDNKKTAWTIKGKTSLNVENKNIELPLSHCKLSSKDESIINLLIEANDWKLIENLLSDNEVMKSWISYQNGNKAISSVQAQEFISKNQSQIDFDDSIYKLAYPMYFETEINQHAETFDIDPYLVLSIMREESHFDTSAKSYVGAGGLMQIMPDTAKFIAEKYNLLYSERLRYDFNKNIELGCAYLDFVLSQLSKKYLFAVAGYNGGPNAVKNWLNTHEYNDFDEFVEEIPYAETQNYIRKVFKSYWNYLNIYDNID